MADYSNGAYLTPLNYNSEEGNARYLFEPNPPTALTDLDEFFPSGTSIGLDTSLDTGIAFYYPTYASATDSVTFETQEMPLDHSAVPDQIVHKSAGGDIAVYSQTYKNRVLDIKLVNVSETKRVRLYKFIANIVDFAHTLFDYIDETGKLYTVRYIKNSWNPRMDAWLSWTINLQLYVISITDP
jgi:hypothetical protein